MDTDKEKEIDLLELLRTVWGARRRVIKYAIVGAVIGLVIGFSIPKTYVTTIKLAPESKSTNAGGSMAGLAAMAGINLNAGVSRPIFSRILSRALRFCWSLQRFR